MNLVFLSHAVDRSNGWGRVAYEVLNELAARQIRFSVFCGLGIPNEAPGDNSIQATLRSTRWGTLQPIRALWDATVLVRKVHAADAVIALDEPSVLAADALARKCNVPFLAVLHGTYAVKTLLGGNAAAHRRAYSRAGGLMFVSKYTRDRFHAVFPEHRGLRFLLPLGVDSDTVVDAPPDFRARRREVLTVGEVKPRKGLLQTVEALVRLPAECRPQVIVAGAYSPDEQYVKAVVERAEMLGVRHLLTFLGRVTHAELEQLYLRVLAFVLPSQNVGDHFEGFGLVHLEAAARGLPCIGSRDCGNEDAVIDGATGHLCEQGDALGLASSIARLITDEAHWSSCSAQSIRWARSRSWSETADTLLQCVAGVMQGKGAFS